MSERLTFTSPGHEQRFFTALQSMEMIHTSGIDQSHGPALYILTTDSMPWELIERDYINGNSIHFAQLKKASWVSGGTSVLIDIAHHLFTHTGKVDLLEVRRLDRQNFHVVLGALQLSYESLMPLDVFPMLQGN